MGTVIIHGGDYIVYLPAPVFIPGKGITDKCTVMLVSEVFIYILQVFVLRIHALHHAGHGAVLWKLGILDAERELVGYDFPPLLR